jgi:hypothetical protein
MSMNDMRWPHFCIVALSIRGKPHVKVMWDGVVLLPIPDQTTRDVMSLCLHLNQIPSFFLCTDPNVAIALL